MRNELKQCGCCCEEDLLEEDLESCDKNHQFCRSTCIRQSAEEVIGQNATVFPCLIADCDGYFSLAVIKRTLPAQIFFNLLRRIQANEILNANIEDLETCPFCDFATIVPNKDDKVFYCLNPECMKDSCRSVYTH